MACLPTKLMVKSDRHNCTQHAAIQTKRRKYTRSPFHPTPELGTTLWAITHHHGRGQRAPHCRASPHRCLCSGRPATNSRHPDDNSTASRKPLDAIPVGAGTQHALPHLHPLDIGFSVGLSEPVDSSSGCIWPRHLPHCAELHVSPSWLGQGERESRRAAWQLHPYPGEDRCPCITLTHTDTQR